MTFCSHENIEFLGKNWNKEPDFDFFFAQLRPRTYTHMGHLFSLTLSFEAQEIVDFVRWNNRVSHICWRSCSAVVMTSRITTISVYSSAMKRQTQLSLAPHGTWRRRCKAGRLDASINIWRFRGRCCLVTFHRVHPVTTCLVEFWLADLFRAWCYVHFLHCLNANC